MVRIDAALLTSLAALSMSCGDDRARSGESDIVHPGSGGSGGVVGTGGNASGGAPPAPFVQNKLYTEHLGKLIGTARTPIADVGLAGTDLGVAFEQEGALVFLFGDSWTLDGLDWDVDSAAIATPGYPTDGGLPALEWLKRPSGRFLPLAPPGIDLGPFNVPVEGVAVGKTTYVFFTTGYSFASDRHTHSVLAHADGLELGAFVVDHVVPSDKFLNVSVVLEGPDAFIFGSGPYRKSAVYLARASVSSLADRASWTYDQGDGAFVPDEVSAAPLVDASCVGEMSVRKHPSLGLWLMTYNCNEPRGIHLRTAATPSGPWSEPTVIFNPGIDPGYEHFMHAASVGYDDGLAEPGREGEWGGEYGPYLVPQWFDSVPSPEGTYSLVYTLSSWNPYSVHLLHTVLGDPSLGVGPPVKGEDLPPAVIENGDFAEGGLRGWQASGDPFVVFLGQDGLFRVTSYVAPKNDAALGQIWQEFTVDAKTSELRFLIHGGDARVSLFRGPDMVRATRGRRQNDPDTEVRWQLSEFRGETLRLVIDDDLTGPWGYVGATAFELY